MDKGKLYTKLYAAFTAANPQLSKQKVQNSCNIFWNDIKDKNEFLDLYNCKIIELQRNTKTQKSIVSFFQNPPKVSPNRQPTPGCSKNSAITAPVKQPKPVKEVISNEINHSGYRTPKQQELSKELNIINQELVGLLARETANLMSEDQKRDAEVKKKRKREIENDLKTLIASQDRMKKYRLNKKEAMQKVIDEHPELESKLKIKSKSGRPPLTDEQPELLNAILEIAMYGSAAHEKRRMESLRSIKTLDELHQELQNMGFKLSRSAVYYHLQPSNIRTLDGKRHVNTVPVKLIRAQNSFHKDHQDSKFAAASINNLNELAAFLGHDEVALISQDDKCRVPIGITAAKAQAPMLMHMQYRVSLPDHDWVIGERHKLIPSVYAGLVVKEKGYGSKEAISFSGPTFIAVRSGKHSSSTAKTHSRDFSRLLNLEEFDDITKSRSGDIKPMFIMLVDGGPDENPRYPKTICAAINHFRNFNLDAIFIATNAPGRSAFNPVERRMAPLSRQLSGVILPYEHYGTHLDANGKTVDVELEIKNFEHAGQTLADIFSNTVIDGYPVVSEYVNPEQDDDYFEETVEADETWKMKHVKTSQYFLQIVKCFDKACCSPPRGSYLNFFPNRFLPAPISIKYNPKLSIASPNETNAHFSSLFQNISIADANKMAYDTYCPSIEDVIKERVCIDCQYYCASMELLKKHRKEIHKRIVNTKKKPKKVISKRGTELMVVVKEDVEWIDSEHLDVIHEEEVENLEFNNLLSIENHLKQIWENV